MRASWLILALLLVSLPSLVSSDETPMSKKSTHAERILRHLALGDLATVHAEAVKLEQITIDTKFEDRGKEYAEYGKEFLKVVRALKDDAGRGNKSAAYYQFTRMTGLCFTCHENVREK